MTKYKCSNFAASSKNALRGLRIVFVSQKNFVIEMTAAVCVFSAALFLKFSASDLCILVLTCAMVLICELINSAVEFTLDAVYKNKYSKLVKAAKDISAGMVLFASAASIITGLILFKSYIKFV